MPLVVKNTMIEYVSQEFKKESIINPARIFHFNNKEINRGNIIYLCEKNIRVKDNFALQFALQKSQELNLALKIIHPKIFYSHSLKQNFIDKQLYSAQQNFFASNLNFEIFSDKELEKYLDKEKIALLIIDFNPITKRKYLKNLPFKIYEIDGTNIVPARFVSDKQEYAAVTIRKKFYYNLNSFLTEFDNIFETKTEADYTLENFLNYKLCNYAQYKNNPAKDVTSGLSKFLNLGFISAQRVAMEVIKADVEDINKEVFLEELIIRQGLAQNFCLYAQNFKDFSNVPLWAKQSLNVHKQDLRIYIYSKKELENAKTHDKLWNATQIQLKKEGKIHGYLRMYWAKKILEWTISPQQALEFSIYLNDKYAYDAPSANGYVSILWSIAGLHDRAFKDYLVTGKIRRMTYNSLKKKFNLQEYIEKFPD